MWESAFAENTNLQIRQIAPIRFGTFTVVRPGALTLDPRSGNCVASGGVVRMRSSCEAAQFEITGTPGRNLLVHLPALVELGSASGARLAVTGLTLYPPAPLALGADGKMRIYAGGVLTADAFNIPPSTYSGFFALSAQYLP